MSTESSSQGARAASGDPSATHRAPGEEPTSEEDRAAAAPPTEPGDPRYASQEAAAEPAPAALEGGANAPSARGITPRREWVFLVLAVFFALLLVSIPAVLFTGIDLTTPGSGDGAPAPEGNEDAREVERRQLLQETRADALSKLNTYGPTDDGAYRIPVERAMRLTLREDYGTADRPGESASDGPVPSGGADVLSN